MIYLYIYIYLYNILCISFSELAILVEQTLLQQQFLLLIGEVFMSFLTYIQHYNLQLILLHQQHIVVLGHLIDSISVALTFVCEGLLVDLGLTNRLPDVLIDEAHLLLQGLHLELVSTQQRVQFGGQQFASLIQLQLP